MDMAMILGGILLPKPSTFKRIITPNETDRTTLGGTLTTDFINNRRTWQVGWKLMSEEDYQIIQSLYLSQYVSGIYHVLQFDAYDIYTPVKINITDNNPKYNGVLVENFTLIIKEQHPFS